MATYKVREDAVLSCTLGTCKSCLKVPGGHIAKVQGKYEASIFDNKVGINIFPFGMCCKTNPPVPCTPVILRPWLLGQKDYKVKKELALLNHCILGCAGGGIIKIDTQGGQHN